MLQISLEQVYEILARVLTCTQTSVRGELVAVVTLAEEVAYSVHTLPVSTQAPLHGTLIHICPTHTRINLHATFLL